MEAKKREKDRRKRDAPKLHKAIQDDQLMCKSLLALVWWLGLLCLGGNYGAHFVAHHSYHWEPRVQVINIVYHPFILLFLSPSYLMVSYLTSEK